MDLGIHIEPKKSEDGLFPVSYIDCQVDICDELKFESRNGEIEIVCDDPEVPIDEKNFIYQAALLLRESSKRQDLGVKITLKKKIPVKAGFGGGSSDGAATIWGLCEFWNIKVSKNQLLEFSKKLGKDFYFSLFGGLGELTSVGRDYQLRPFKSDLSFWTVVVVPYDEKPSTAWIYEHLDTKNIGKNQHKLIELKKALLKGDRVGFMSNLSNDFESSVSRHFPIVTDALANLAEAGASGKIMAGAGLSVVGFFESQIKAKQAAKTLERNPKYRKVLISKTNFDYVQA